MATVQTNVQQEREAVIRRWLTEEIERAEAAQQPLRRVLEELDEYRRLRYGNSLGRQSDGQVVDDFVNERLANLTTTVEAHRETLGRLSGD